MQSKIQDWGELTDASKNPTAETYEAMQYAYAYFNRVLFQNKLPTCLITFQRQKRIMGYVSFKRWVNSSRQYVDELAINPEYFANYPLIEICQTLCHEMVHIWQAHFGRPSRRNYHNTQWAEKMKSIGLYPSTTGKPGGDTTGEKVGDYIVHDGPFHRACQDLLHEGFVLRWVDRYPVFRNEDPIAIYNTQAERVDVANDLVSITSLAASRAFRSEATTSFANIEVLDDEEGNDVFQLPSVTPSMGVLNPVSQAQSSQPLNRSNRHKYVCKGCGMQVWGKPALHVICGACQLNLTEYS